SLMQSVAHRENGLFELEGLFDEIGRAEFRGANCGLDVGVARDHNDGHIGIVGFDAFKSFEAVYSRQPYVEHNATAKTILEEFQTLLAARCGFDFEPFVFQNALERLPNAGLVINNQYSFRHLLSHLPQRAQRSPRDLLKTFSAITVLSAAKILSTFYLFRS